jgi:Bacterial inner membrane protein
VFEWVGWTATAAFSASYFCRRPQTLRRVQAVAALLWLTYGVLIHSAPVVVANVIVASLAMVSSLRGEPQGAREPVTETSRP